MPYREQDSDPPYGYNLLHAEPTYADVARNNIPSPAQVVQLPPVTNGAVVSTLNVVVNRAIVC